MASQQQVDAQLVIAAMQRQIAELSYRLALAEAQLTQQHEEAPDGEA